jgi:hypothetical protein
MGDYICRNLQIDGKLGEPGATRCMAYDVRFDGMPILGRNAEGHTRVGACRKNSTLEDAVIVKWIGHGCSLKEGNDGRDA